MSDIDKFIQEELMPFYTRTFEAFKQKHHALYLVVNSFLAGKQNYVGARITESGNLLGEYTFHLDGASISHIENVLSSELHTPFGIIRPFVILEKSTVEKILQDEPNFIKDPIKTKLKYFRDMTIKFL